MDRQPPHDIQADRDVDEVHWTPSAMHDQQSKHAAAMTAIMCAITTSLDAATSFAVVAQQAQHILSHDALVILLPHTESRTGADSAWVVAFCAQLAVEP